MINSLFALKLFEAFSIERWNDRIRPIVLNEMDRSGHKMMIAYLLGKYEEKNGENIEWDKIIYGGLFELLKKIVLSDIKAPVHRKIKKDYPEEFKKLNKWVVQQYEIIIEDQDLLDNFYEYIDKKENLDDINFKILRAAHKYSSLREFEIIKNSNTMTPDLQKIEKELNAEIEEFYDIKGLKSLILKQELFDFVTKIEQLRYQVRWGQSPRIPKTSVMGHSMLVATLSLLFTREFNPTDKRVYNNFFAGLFHDLPEAVTRDIISPVKKATEKLPDIVKIIEKEIVSEQLYPLIGDFIQEELKYFTEKEFKNKIIKNGTTKEVTTKKINDKYNSDEFSPLDGELIRLSDQIAAYLEAYKSIEYGISSSHLEQGKTYIYNDLKENNPVCGLDIRKFLMELE